MSDSNMYFDTDSFDFDSLTDIVGLHDTPSKPTPHKEPSYRTEEDDISDLIGSMPQEEVQEQDFNNDVSDLNRSREEDNAIALTVLDDEKPIEFEGMRLTAGELKELYKAKHKVDADSEFIQSHAQKFHEDNRVINQRAIMQQTQLENNIVTLRNRLNNSALSGADYETTHRQLQACEGALMRHMQEVNQIMAMRDQEKEMINGLRIRNADQQMINEYPQWMQLKGQVKTYANELGMTDSQIAEFGDTPLFKALFKAMMYDNNKKRLASAPKGSTQAINPRSTTGAKESTRNTSVNAEDKLKAQRALNQMGTRSGNIAAFNYLKD